MFTATLLLHSLDAEIIEALITSEWMRELMRDGIEIRSELDGDKSPVWSSGSTTPKSETQAEERGKIAQSRDRRYHEPLET